MFAPCHNVAHRRLLCPTDVQGQGHAEGFEGRAHLRQRVQTLLEVEPQAHEGVLVRRRQHVIVQELQGMKVIVAAVDEREPSHLTGADHFGIPPGQVVMHLMADEAQPLF
jgi:hypothetical protein